jgi:hypothetical protein
MLLASALLALRSWAVRIMNTVFAIWLAAFTLSLAEEALPRGGVMTSWHDLAVAAVVFALSLVPNPEEPRPVVRNGRARDADVAARGPQAARRAHASSQVSLAPPPLDELTTSVPAGATRVNAGGTTTGSAP